MIGIAGFIVASIGLVLSVIYVQGAKIRQTERIIYTQGSALASSYRTVLRLHTQDSTTLETYGKVERLRKIIVPDDPNTSRSKTVTLLVNREMKKLNGKERKNHDKSST